MDTEGGVLGSNANRLAGLDASQLKYTAEIEGALASRLSSILEPLAGKEGFRAQVTVDVDFEQLTFLVYFGLTECRRNGQSPDLG
jgi:flagellar M-ring protein FliF